MVILKTRTGMIPANETEISFTDPLINDDSIIEVYFDNDDVYALETWQNGTTVHIITNDHEGAVGIKIFINNVSSFAPYDDGDIRERVAQTVQDIINLETTVDELETTVDELESTVDGLNASNINYDEHSTLYSAMGDIDSLETDSKNLVGAINEVKESGGGSKTDYIISRKFTSNYNIGGSTYLDKLFTYTPVEGYTPLVAIPTTAQNGAAVVWSNCNLEGTNGIRIYLRNIASYSISNAVVTVTVLFVKNS